MRHMRMATCGCVVALMLATGACAPASAKEPFTCEIHLNSLEGSGSVDVVRIDPNPKLPFPVRPLQIFWHPPIYSSAAENSPMNSAEAHSAMAAASSMDLIVGYREASLKDFGLSHGGRLQFPPGIGSSAGQFEAIVNDGGTQAWRFKADPDFGPDQGDFIFSADDPAGKAVTAAINSGKIIKVTILKDGKEMASDSFDTSVVAGRDKLLANVRPLFETLDPRYCRPE